MFSTGGLIGQVKWNGVVTSKSAEQAPCSEGVPLHCFLQGGDLLQTLHLNLIPFQVLGVENLGVPLWELDSIKASAAADGTFFGRMAPMARAMALEPSGNKLKLANGLKYAKLPEFIDPFLTRIKTSKDLPAYLRIDLAKHPWRELQAVLALARRGAGSPEQLRHLLDLPPDTIVRLWTGGMEIDQAKILGFGEWSFVFPAALAQGDSIMKAYSDGVECASLAISLLKDAFKKMNNENKVKIVPSFAKEQAVPPSGMDSTRSMTNWPRNPRSRISANGAGPSRPRRSRPSTKSAPPARQDRSSRPSRRAATWRRPSKNA
jgi:hypothetical protein